MNNQNERTKIISSLFWKLMERGGTQGVQFVVQIILARLISPEEFGILALVMVFINLAQVFVQSGFNTALIQKKDADTLDFSSIFYLSLLIAGFFYLIMYTVAPVIADFYDSPELISVLRVLSLILFTGAFNSIQNAYVSKKLLFKKLFRSSIGATIISGVLGIIAAYQGAGIWALVIQQLANQLSVTIIMWFTVKWRPHLMFSFTRVKTLLSFSWKLLASSLLDVLYMDLRTLIIGRIYTASTLGYYNRGQQFPRLIVNNVNGSIQAVMLPALSVYQDDKERMKSFVRRSIVTSSFLIFPMMIGMAVIAEPLVTLVLTETWLPAVPFLQIFSLSYMLMPIHTANLQAINAMGRSDIFLKLEVIKKVLGLIVLAISLPFGVYAIALGQLLSGIISSFINAYPNKILLNYGYTEQVSDVLPSLALSAIMGIVVYAFNLLKIAIWRKLLIQVFIGTVVYILIAYLFKNESLFYLLNIMRDVYRGRRKNS